MYLTDQAYTFHFLLFPGLMEVTRHMNESVKRPQKYNSLVLSNALVKSSRKNRPMIAAADKGEKAKTSSQGRYLMAKRPCNFSSTTLLVLGKEGRSFP